MELRRIARLLGRQTLAVLALLLSTTCATTLDQAAPTDAAIPRFGHVELGVQVPHPGVADDAVKIRGTFTSPGGRTRVVPGFAHRGAFAVRFSPDEIGEWKYRLEADAGRGFATVAGGAFATVEGVLRGPVKRDPVEARALSYADGTPFVMLGENRFNIYDSAWNAGKRDIEDYVAWMASNGMNALRVFVFSDCDDEESPDRYQTGCLEPVVGRFDDATGDRFDRIFEAAEKQGISVIVTVFAGGSTPGAETWRSWDDNPYAEANGGPAREPVEFFDLPQAREMAKKRLDYVLARWGAYANLLAVDLLDEPESDGPVPEASWVPWAIEMADHWHRLDPYGRLVTAGPVGLSSNVGEADERPWYAAPGNDLVQWHLQGKEFREPHALAAEMKRRALLGGGFGKPEFCGDFATGGADDDHTHVGIWTAVFSGSGVLARSAPPFQGVAGEPMTPERGKHFRTLSNYLARLATVGRWMPVDDVHGPGANVFSLASEGDRAIWLLAPDSRYGEAIQVDVTLPRRADGLWRVQWMDDVTGETLGEGSVDATSGRLKTPPFKRHVVAIATYEPALPPTPRTR